MTRRQASAGVLLVIACTRTCGSQTTDPADASTATDPAVTAWLSKADRQHRSGAYHLEAEALEEALGLLKPGHPERWPTSQRLVELYRGGLGCFARAAFWVRTVADELRPTPEGIDALFELADTEFNHGDLEEALAVYKEILHRIMAPDPPYDRLDQRCWPAWHGEGLCKRPAGCDPLFRSDLTVTSLLNRFLQLTRSGTPREACSLLDRNLSLRSVVQWGREPRVWLSAREWLARAVAQLSKDSLATLESRYERAIADMANRRDWRALAAFRFHHPLPTVERRIDVAIGEALLDLSMPGLASLFYGEALRGSPRTAPPALLAKALFSRIHAGEVVPVTDVPDVQADVGGQRRSLRAWVEIWQGPAAGTEITPPPIDLDKVTISSLPLVRARLPLRQWQLRWLARRDMGLPAYADEFVPCIPVGSPRSLIVNVGDAIQAVDVVDGRSLWTFLAPEENSMTFPNQKYENKKLFVECARARTAAVAGERVYCHLAWGHHDTRRPASGIFALRRSDGAMLWSSLYMPELAGMQMAGDPAVYRGVVVSAAWRPRETVPLFYVVGLAAETGELLWVSHLFSGSSLTVRNNNRFLDRPLACGPPAIADGVAYLCTGAGVAAAVSVLDGSLVWAIEYPRIRGVNKSPWATRLATSRPAGMVAVHEDVVLFAPIDSYSLLVVDRFTGQLRYTQESLDLRAIAAADAGHAYLLEGTTVRAIHPGDGQTAWQRTLPTSGVVGLPTLSNRGLLCPSWEALFVLDPSSGEIRTRRPWHRREACSHIQDFGDRLVGASRTGLHVLADEALSEADDWRLPPNGKSGPVDVGVPSRADKWLRWALPAVNRGDFCLSAADPEHMLVRSELLQMRGMDPLPSLRWERSSPLPWGCDVVFDRNRVALWDESHLFVLEASSGRTLWEDRLTSPLRPAPGWGVVLDGDDLFWWGARRMHCYRAGTGENRWAAPLDGTIRGLRPLERSVGVYLELRGSRDQTDAHAAVILDRATGRERARFSIVRPPPLTAPARTPTGKPVPWADLPSLIAGRMGPGARAAPADVVLVDGVQPVRIDWAKRTAVPGQAIKPLLAKVTCAAALEVYDEYVCLRGRDDRSPRHHEPLLAVWDHRTLSRIDAPPATTWCVSGDALYAFSRYRIKCVSLSNGRQRWQSLTLLDRPRVMVPTNDHLLVLTQDGWFDGKKIRDVSYIRVFDIHTGERVKAFRIPKRWVHVLDQQADRLVLWDCTFLYNLQAPTDALPLQGRPVLVHQAEADPGAIASLRMARDLEDPPRMEIPELAASPQIDGDLSDWPDTAGRSLAGLMDFKPDFAHRSRWKTRMYGGKADFSAIVRAGRTKDSLLLAVEVADDAHVTSPGPGLWRSDSMTLLFAEAGAEEVDPVMLTVALVSGRPRFEFGTAVSTFAVSDPPGYEPTCGQGPRTFLLPPLKECGTIVIQPGAPIEVAIRRDESLRRTSYELELPKEVFAHGANLLYWDLLVNDNDGLGREGGLQLASSVWGIEETAIGSIPGTE